MRIIYFKENEKEIWNEFIAENNSESFLQSWEWGKFQERLVRKIWRIGIVDDGSSSEDEKRVSSTKHQVLSNNLITTALVIKHDLPFGKSYLYCPRGMVMEKRKTKNEKRKIMDLLFSEVKKIAEKEKSLFLRIDPPVELNDESRIMNYEYSPNFKKSPNEIQPGDTLILDLTKSEEEILKEMKQKTRYNIRLAERKELRITNLEYGILNLENFKKGFEEFWKLIKETSTRDKFASHNKNYYRKMLESLSETKGDISECRLRARLYLAKYENKIIAANVVLYFGDLAIYLHGASSGEYRNLMAPHLLQWRQILDAKSEGCKKYDFWGIAQECQMSNVKCQMKSKFNNNWSGITRFKKGFGGEEKNYIGAYDLVFNSIGYTIYKSIKFIATFKV